jgi:hypothetical protein
MMMLLLEEDWLTHYKEKVKQKKVLWCDAYLLQDWSIWDLLDSVEWMIIEPFLESFRWGLNEVEKEKYYIK